MISEEPHHSCNHLYREFLHIRCLSQSGFPYQECLYHRRMFPSVRRYRSVQHLMFLLLLYHLPLPQYFLTYSYNGDTYTVSPPLDVDELIITKQLFTYIPPRQRIQVYVFSIDRYGRKQTIADSMIIEFR